MDALAVDRHGTVYYSVLGIQQVTAVVRADAVELPSDTPFPWSVLLWGAVVLVVLAAAGWWFLRRRAATNADHGDHSGHNAQPAADSESEQEPRMGQLTRGR